MTMFFVRTMGATVPIIGRTAIFTPLFIFYVLMFFVRTMGTTVSMVPRTTIAALAHYTTPFLWLKLLRKQVFSHRSQARMGGYKSVLKEASPLRPGEPIAFSTKQPRADNLDKPAKAGRDAKPAANILCASSRQRMNAVKAWIRNASSEEAERRV